MMPFSCVFDFLDTKRGEGKKRKVPDCLKVSVVVIAGLKPHSLLSVGSKTPTLRELVDTTQALLKHVAQNILFVSLKGHVLETVHLTTSRKHSNFMYSDMSLHFLPKGKKKALIASSIQVNKTVKYFVFY